MTSQPGAGVAVGSTSAAGMPVGLLFALAAGPFLSMVDSIVVTVATPDIARGPHTTTAAASGHSRAISWRWPSVASGFPPVSVRSFVDEPPRGEQWRNPQ